MTKSEQIFKTTYRTCKNYIKNNGYKENICFTRMSTDELIYKRTATEIRKYIASAYKDIEIDLELNIITLDEAVLETEVLKMVENTLNNSYIA